MAEQIIDIRERIEKMQSNLKMIIKAKYMTYLIMKKSPL